jgi:hypothetical protein
VYTSAILKHNAAILKVHISKGSKVARSTEVQMGEIGNVSWMKEVFGSVLGYGSQDGHSLKTKRYLYPD